MDLKSTISHLPTIIAPSLLSFDFAKLADESKHLLECGADWLHVDVMDGHFVDNLTIGAPVVKALRKHSDAFLDCHLMVSDPAKWLKDFAEAGASQFIFHTEAMDDFGHVTNLIHRIKAFQIRAGVSVKPGTPIREMPWDEWIAAGLDYVLIMTVEPGFGGQEFMQDMLQKVRYLRMTHPELDIGVDGGVKIDNVALCGQSGANVIVSGSGIKRTDNHRQTIEEMRNRVKLGINSF